MFYITKTTIHDLEMSMKRIIGTAKRGEYFYFFEPTRSYGFKVEKVKDISTYSKPICFIGGAHTTGEVFKLIPINDDAFTGHLIKQTIALCEGGFAVEDDCIKCELVRKIRPYTKEDFNFQLEKMELFAKCNLYDDKIFQYIKTLGFDALKDMADIPEFENEFYALVDKGFENYKTPNVDFSNSPNVGEIVKQVIENFENKYSNLYTRIFFQNELRNAIAYALYLASNNIKNDERAISLYKDFAVKSKVKSQSILVGFDLINA